MSACSACCERFGPGAEAARDSHLLDSDSTGERQVCKTEKSARPPVPTEVSFHQRWGEGPKGKEEKLSVI